MLLIDGDQFLFKATAAVEEEVRWDEQNHVLYSNAEKAWTNLFGMINRVKARFTKQGNTILCFTKAPNFRQELDPTYKAHRDPRKPLCYAALRERCEEEWDCKAFAGLEADDVMGILATGPKSKGSGGAAAATVIVSQDKDMKTIPATIWDGQDLVTYSETEADYWHLYQTLIGDTSDGYKGCPGVGPKKAEKILELREEATVGGTWREVVAAYEKAGLTEADALVQARLARILRYSDWDNKKKEVKLWTPPST